MTSTLTAVAVSKVKLDKYWKSRKISTPSSCGASPSPAVKVDDCPNGAVSEEAPPDRQKTATLKRRDTFHGKIPVDSRCLALKPPKLRRPRRSVSDESSSSSSMFSVSCCNDDDPSHPEQTAYEQALAKLSSDERWTKEMALGTRIGLYRLYRDLGKGNFSKVKVAVHWLTKEKVAVKIIDKTRLQPKNKQMLGKEISIMETIRQHPNVIRLFEVLETPCKVYLAMEFAEGGELFDKVTSGGKFPEPEAKVLFAQVVSAVGHLHKHNVVHRDIKAENIFISSCNRVKLGDFGFSTRVQHPREVLLTLCGSPPYVSPELLQNENYAGPSVDLWALGVLLYFLVTASLPFRGDTLSAVKKKILCGHFLLPKHLSSECGDLIRGLLHCNPGKRWTVNQVKSCSWLKGVPYPNSNEENRSSEKEAKCTLRQMGIDEDLLHSHKEKGARSSVVGTYRILLHKIEERNAAEGKTSKKFLKWPKFQSKTCTIM